MSEVTVVIPSYNHAPFVERTLRSVFAQTLPPKKLIVIDDGSKDESVAIIERVLRDCPFDAELIVRENRGVCFTLNQGLSMTETPFFAYVSSDDLWLPDFLKRRTETLDRRPAAVLSYGYSLIIDEDDRITDSTRNWAKYADGNALDMLLYPIIPASAAVLYRLDAIAPIGWNEEAKLEDYELYLKLSTRGEFALDGGEPLSAWRIHGYNTSSDFGAMMAEWITAQNRVRHELGLTESELRNAQDRLRFRCVKDFLRRGDRLNARELFAQSYRSAAWTDVVATALRFAVPASFYRKLKPRPAEDHFSAPR